MTRIRSAFRFALPLALFLGATALTTVLATTTAQAETEKLGSWTSREGTVWTVYQHDDGKWNIVIDSGDRITSLSSDSVAIALLQKGDFKWSNPSPDDSTGKGSDKPDVVGALEKLKGIEFRIRVEPDNTPLAKWISSNGNGNVPHWNPGDSDGNGPGLAPKGNSDGPTPKQIADIERVVNEIASDLAGIRNSMGDGVDGLGSEDAPGPNKGNGNSGRGKGTGDGSGNNDNKVKYSPGGEATTLGPRPDLVNPAPKNKIGSASLFTPGLLESTGGLTGNGPSGTGGGSRVIGGGPPR